MREDGTAHGTLVAIIEQGTGDTEETFRWALEEDPEPTGPGRIGSEEPARRTVLGARLMGLVPTGAGHNAVFATDQLLGNLLAPRGLTIHDQNLPTDEAGLAFLAQLDAVGTARFDYV